MVQFNHDAWRPLSLKVSSESHVPSVYEDDLFTIAAHESSDLSQIEVTKADRDHLKAALAEYPEALQALSQLEQQVDVQTMQSIIALGADVARASLTGVHLRSLPSERYSPVSWSPAEEQRFRTAALRRFGEFLRVAAEHQEQLSILMRRLSADQLTFFEVYRDALKHGMDVEMISGASIETKQPEELSEDQKSELLAIAETNWADVPAMQPLVVNELRTILEQGKGETIFRVLMLEGKVAACIRFERLDDGNVYAGSLNVSPFLRGGAIGEAFLRTVVDTMAEHHRIHARVLPQKTVGTAYVETFGCVVTGVQDVVLPTGETMQQFCVLRDDRVNASYAARKTFVSTADIRAEVQQQGPLANQGIRVEKFDLSTQEGVERFVAAVRQAEAASEVVTRYVADHDQSTVRYVAFEKRRSLD